MSALSGRTLCADLPAAVPVAGCVAQVMIEGWIHRRRRLSSVTFLIVRDRSGTAQVVVTDPAVRARIDELGEETVVRVSGSVVANPQAPGGVEITSAVLTALSSAAATPRSSCGAPSCRPASRCCWTMRR